MLRIYFYKEENKTEKQEKRLMQKIKERKVFIKVDTVGKQPEMRVIGKVKSLKNLEDMTW